MTTTLKLSDTQLVILVNASRRSDGAVLPLPVLRQPAGKSLANLLKRGCITEVELPDRTSPAWREDDRRRIGLAITEVGLAAIGAEAVRPRHVANDDAIAKPATASGASIDSSSCASPAPTPPGSGDPTSTPAPAAPRGKTAILLDLLAPDEGTTVAQLTTTLGWQPHTVRAALSRLRRGGHTITTTRADGTTRYRLVHA